MLFIETWTYFDKYDTTQYSTADEAFSIVDAQAPGVLWSRQITNVNNHIGKNFIILPFGYLHYLALNEYHYEMDEWISFYSRYSDKWQQLIQDYFDGKDRSNQSDSSADEATLMKISIEDWQNQLRETWRGSFLSPRNLEIIRHSNEAYLDETKNGIVLYIISDPETPKDHQNDYYEEYTYCWDIRYDTYRYNYCLSHYIRFMNRLETLQNDFSINCQQVKKYQ